MTVLQGVICFVYLYVQEPNKYVHDTPDVVKFNTLTAGGMVKGDSDTQVLSTLG